MAFYNIFQGGDRVNGASLQMYPTVAANVCNEPYSYADHQRSRSYGVTRRIDLRAISGNSTGGVDRALSEYVSSLTLIANDVLNTHLLLPNTLLLGVSYGISSPVAGLTFDIIQVTAGTTLAAGVSAATVPVNSTGCALASHVAVNSGAGLLLSEVDTIGIKLTALPAGGIAKLCGAGGLNMWITAHVLDLENGNA